MGVVKFVVLVLLLYLVAVTAGDVTCESEYGGTCNLTSKTCYQDHQYDRCTSFVRSQNRPISSPPNCGECPGEQSTSGYGMQAQWVNVTASTYDSTYFNVHVSWGLHDSDVRQNLVQGFRVSLKEKVNDELYQLNLGCVCLNASQRNYTFTYNDKFQYKTSGNFKLVARVMMLPLDVQNNDYVNAQEANTRIHTINFPRSCRDLPYDPIHCKPPEYNPPRNVLAYRSTCGLRENNTEEMSIRVSWNPPLVPSPYPDPSVYYVQVQNENDELNVFSIKTNNTQSVSIHHLNASLAYQVSIITYVPCSDGGNHGCSFPSNWDKVVPELSSSPMPMPSSTMMISNIIISTVTASPTETPLSGIQTSENNITEPIAIASSIAGVLILAIIIAIGIVIATRCYLIYAKRGVSRSSSYDNLILPPPRQIDIYGHAPQTVEVEAHPPSPRNDYRTTTCYPPAPNISSTSHTVLVVYSLDSNQYDEGVILQFLVFELRKRSISAITPKDLQRGNLPLWMEDQMKKADAVLCVCNEALYEEWNRNPETAYTSRAVVHSLKAIIGGSLSQSKDLSAFLGIVLLKQSDKKFIPSSYLAGTPSFLVDEIENIARFVAQVPHFEVSSSSSTES